MKSSDELARLRKDYSRHTLDELEVDLSPFVQFRRWFEEAMKVELT
jgi:pyridoxamine 5'-phosphate oxidase